MAGAFVKRNTMSKSTTTFLGFEQAIAELDAKIEELRFVKMTRQSTSRKRSSGWSRKVSN